MNDQRAQELLSAERSRLEEELRRLGPARGAEDNEVGRDSGDAGSELFEEQRDAGIAESLRERLAALQRAEQRHAEGKYGLSVHSGDPIPDERLEFDPAAELTVDEQRKLEGGR
jgi:DnaK suppressor protein